MIRTSHAIGIAYHCPKCGKDLDCHHCANSPEPRQPQVNDIIICSHCKTVTEVVDDRAGVCRALNREELDRLPSSIVKHIEAYLYAK